MLKKCAIVLASLALAAPGAVSAAEVAVPHDPPPGPDCDEHRHHPDDACVCDHYADFYGPVAPWRVSLPGGPGIRVRGRPVVIPSGRVDIQGPPIYVEAPPIRIQAPQIYLHAPDVHVRPSDVTVEPPEIHYVGCPDGQPCRPAGEY